MGKSCIFGQLWIRLEEIDLNPESRAIQNKKFFSKISAQEEGIMHEEESIYGSTDRLCAAPGRDGHAGFRSLPQDGNIRRDVL